MIENLYSGARDLGSHPSSTTYRLCGLSQVTQPLCASVSPLWRRASNRIWGPEVIVKTQIMCASCASPGAQPAEVAFQTSSKDTAWSSTFTLLFIRRLPAWLPLAVRLFSSATTLRAHDGLFSLKNYLSHLCLLPALLTAVLGKHHLVIQHRATQCLSELN